jgi:hypothetical protein
MFWRIDSTSLQLYGTLVYRSLYLDANNLGMSSVDYKPAMLLLVFTARYVPATILLLVISGHRESETFINYIFAILFKLSSLAMPSIVVRWIVNFLTGRTPAVSLDGKLSKW